MIESYVHKYNYVNAGVWPVRLADVCLYDAAVCTTRVNGLESLYIIILSVNVGVCLYIDYIIFPCVPIRGIYYNL